jgi:hypothetical protein
VGVRDVVAAHEDVEVGVPEAGSSVARELQEGAATGDTVAENRGFPQDVESIHEVVDLLSEIDVLVGEREGEQTEEESLGALLEVALDELGAFSGTRDTEAVVAANGSDFESVSIGPVAQDPEVGAARSKSGETALRLARILEGVEDASACGLPRGVDEGRPVS